jgi:serine/threonine protein kinase
MAGRARSQSMSAATMNTKAQVNTLQLAVGLPSAADGRHRCAAQHSVQRTRKGTQRVTHACSRLVLWYIFTAVDLASTLAGNYNIGRVRRPHSSFPSLLSQVTLPDNWRRVFWKSSTRHPPSHKHRVAIKQIPKAVSAQLTREIHHHRQLHHPHVAQLYEVIATESNIWLVTELCAGGELFDYLVEKGRIDEYEARIIFGQLCLAVGYVHDRGAVHRDLKLENVLLDERCRVKLSDFGFTREFEKSTLLDTFCGTIGYASPEMLLGQKYLGQGEQSPNVCRGLSLTGTSEVDIWSLGIILYALLTGTLPFDDDDEIITKEKILTGTYEDPEWLSSGTS